MVYVLADMHDGPVDGRWRAVSAQPATTARAPEEHGMAGASNSRDPGQGLLNAALIKKLGAAFISTAPVP